MIKLLFAGCGIWLLFITLIATLLVIWFAVSSTVDDIQNRVDMYKERKRRENNS